MTAADNAAKLLFSMKTLFAGLVCMASLATQALNYPYAPYNEGKMDPQKTGWPLIEEEREYVLLPEHERRPGREINQHKPALWPVTPSAGFWGGTSWLDTHANLVKVAQANKGPIDVLLVGDSITIQWGAAWTKHFPTLKTVNLGIGGDRMESLLWRLDHGALDGAAPKVIMLKIGVNNAPLVFANGAPAASAAHGIKLCIENLRMRCPKSQIVLMKILPAFDPSKEAGKAVVDINAALDALELERDSQIHVLDLWSDFTNADGTRKTALYSDGHLHLGPAGYEIFDGQFQTDFWSYSMFQRIATNLEMKPSPGTLGLLMNPEHAALAQFPTEFHSNWQWWHMVKNGRAVVLDAAPRGYRPIVQVIDNVSRNHKLGLVFEFQVGKGKLLICTADLLKLKDRPEAAQLLHSLLAYAASENFNPATTIDLAILKRIMGILVIHA